MTGIRAVRGPLSHRCYSDLRGENKQVPGGLRAVGLRERDCSIGATPLGQISVRRCDWTPRTAPAQANARAKAGRPSPTV